jgi:hypothetical protein
MAALPRRQRHGAGTRRESELVGRVLAAYRARVERVILPRRNEADLEELPKEVKERIRFILADSAEDLLQAAFTPQRPHATGVTEPAGPPPPPVH